MVFLGPTFKWEDGDIVFNPNTKRIDVVEGKANTIGQAIQHIILTQIGSHRMHPTFGTDIFSIMDSPNPVASLEKRFSDLKIEYDLATLSWQTGLTEDRNVSIQVELEDQS